MAAVKKPHKGQWKKGQSGNPSGRPHRHPIIKQFDEACRDHVVELLPTLVEAVKDDKIPLRERREIFFGLADRGFGRPVDRQVQLTLGEGTGSTERVSRDVLEARAAALLERVDLEVISEQ